MTAIIQTPSPNFGERRGAKEVTCLVLHYTDMTSSKAALDRMCDPETEVSAHYLIDEDGGIYQLVDEAKRAWHAGLSFWDGESDVNSVSIGIELANSGHTNGLTPFPAQQIKNLFRLSKEICARQNIPSHRVIGHSDIAPGRKVDPGPLFPWVKLAEMGLGLWPEVANSNFPISTIEDMIAENLAKLGYDVTDISQTISAFQLHYRSDKFDGIADDETKAILHDIHRQTKAIAEKP